MPDAGPPPHAAPASRPAAPRGSAPDSAPDSTPPQGAHGGEIYRVARELGVEPEHILDCSSNGFAHARGLTHALVEAQPHPFEHYPDSASTALREELAAHEELAPDNIMVGNGSSELIWLILRVLQPRRVTLLGPTFSEYARACEAHAIPWRVLHADPMRALDAPPPDFRAGTEADAEDELVVLCSPGNPCPVTAPDLPALVAALFRSGFRTVLADLTYRDFLWGSPEHDAHRHAALAPARPPSPTGGTLLCLHSFTKFFHCTGIRLGYLTGPERLLDLLQSRRPPWMVSPFAEAMGRRFLHALPDYRAHLAALRADRAVLLDGLRRLGVFDPHACNAGPSFTTCRLSEELLRIGVTADMVRRELLHHGMLVRSCDNIPGMPSGYIRMQVRRHGDNEQLVRQIAALSTTLPDGMQEAQ
ncbi:aminotransferase class I/II-fold pyridoxal phosphate-dependent enzyme [Nitratidesulfovibrio sp. SRB-5]|uniref:aminotransferase class I/II-fold pyridoxal phosphate-dependent enzyme n=1 Tax=Nitratidesulfovibrio sp. SRB-5 TaxID=2872636 RepID=UPI001027A4D0|nr:aminotransferase class I/II-fold pyridoxal phosphate-dependent enzyme [Nitratidesulfovibrio sp. SRB-5]MBZ2171190.1 aminotransferase class I/II-fold pyridoxal phosphate-dependent enzyme [Nitratidesulfovibrio sp. SRB-5]RXF75891.1 aminotransferase class I/II-fold pyridoxal phosphate-dependent enzyme [Desulfovibrio sp. DS-1]